MEIENKTLEILDLVREKVLSPDEALPHILRLFNVVGRSKQLPCGKCENGLIWSEDRLKAKSCDCGK